MTDLDRVRRELEPVRDHYDNSYRLHEGIAKSHAKKIAQLEKELDFERKSAADDHERSLREWNAAAKQALVAGGVAAVVSLSYEQLILAVPGDLLYVRQRERGEWAEHLYSPADEHDQRVCLDEGCKRQLRFPAQNVAPKADEPPPEIKA